MKKLITFLITSLLLMSTCGILAQISQPTPGPSANICCDENSVLVNILKYMTWILIVVAAIFIVIAGYYFVTAAGNPETISKARNFVLYALVGVLVAVLARGLVWFVAKLGGFQQ